ncbi:unnamed protein product [Rotaria sp. Silwood1]|nr:unnamed protein product [Rotaria sp. Silwood1]CAF1652454.1 unnamed protein product [Rotaria sp. Silwood1]
MVCCTCLRHNDHSVVSSSLETLEIILKYSNLFDFGQLLISTQIGSIEEIGVSQALNTDITYLLSLCEHGDLHLRGACANLLVTLIKTTIHLLTLSSLSNSFINSFINQCSLVSTDSQDSSRLFIKSQQMNKCFESSTNDSRNDKDTSTTSNTDKNKKVNRTQLGTFGNNP